MMPGGRLEHDALVELIFDCAESVSGLEPALAAIAARLGTDQAHTLVFRRGQLIDSHIHGYDPRGFREYERHWQDKDPRLRAAVASPGRVFSDVQIMEPRAFESTALYSEFLRGTGMRYTLFTNVEIAPEVFLAQAFLRRKQDGAFGEEEIRGLTRLLPSLRRALHLRQLISTLREELQDLRRALELVPGPIALLEASGRLICCNSAAEQLFTKADGVLLQKQVVTARLLSEAHVLAEALSRTARLAEGTSRRSSTQPEFEVLPLTRQQGQPLGVMLMPLRPSSELREHGPRTARLLALFHDPEAVLRLDPDVIARLHGLTPTEALLASSLAEGQSLARFAAARGCTEQTARTHLKRVLDKTGTRRQPELVRVLLASAAFHLTRR